MRKYIVGLLGALAASAILLFPAAFGDFQKGIVNAEDVTLRKSASAESASVKKLPRGAEVTVATFEDGWFKIEYGEFSGYVKQDQLTLKSIASEVVSSGKVLLDDVNLRSKPDVNSSIITVLKIDASVEVSEKIDNWYKITSGKNKGYVQCEYIELTEPAAPAAPAFNALKMGMSGKEVVSLQEQLRALGYYKAESHGNFGAFTRDAVKAFQQTNGLLSDGVATVETQELLFSAAAAPAPQPVASPASSVEALDWADVDKLFPINAEATLTDVRTGTTYAIRRVRGATFAEVEPLTTEDTDAILSTSGGEWSKDIRPVILNISGRKIAAAIRPFPRGKDSEPASDNSMEGTLPLHFKGSVLAEARRVSPPFQAAVTEAMKSGAPQPGPQQPGPQQPGSQQWYN